MHQAGEYLNLKHKELCDKQLLFDAAIKRSHEKEQDVGRFYKLLDLFLRELTEAGDRLDAISFDDMDLVGNQGSSVEDIAPVERF